MQTKLERLLESLRTNLQEGSGEKVLFTSKYKTTLNNTLCSFTYETSPEENLYNVKVLNHIWVRSEDPVEAVDLFNEAVGKLEAKYKEKFFPESVLMGQYIKPLSLDGSKMMNIALGIKEKG